MKQLDKHYYHVTCLILLNQGSFIIIQSALKEDLSPSEMGSLIHVLSIWLLRVKQKDSNVNFVRNLQVEYKGIDCDAPILFVQPAHIRFVHTLMDAHTFYGGINLMNVSKLIFSASITTLITVITMIQGMFPNKHIFADICAI